jgi:hypothetical protein
LLAYPHGKIKNKEFDNDRVPWGRLRICVFIGQNTHTLAAVAAILRAEDTTLKA